MENELIELINHIHNITSSILLKFHTGTDLTEDEEEVMSQLYLCSEEGYLKALEDISHRNNIYINSIIMSRTKGSKNKKTIFLNTENMNKFNLDAVVVSSEDKTFGDVESPYNKILELFAKRMPADLIQKFCEAQMGQEKLTVRKAVRFAILNDGMDKKTGEQKYEIGKLAARLDTESPEFTVGELDQFKKAVGNIYTSPEIVVFIWDTIENKIEDGKYK